MSEDLVGRLHVADELQEHKGRHDPEKRGDQINEKVCKVSRNEVTWHVIQVSFRRKGWFNLFGFDHFHSIRFVAPWSLSKNWRFRWLLSASSWHICDKHSWMIKVWHLFLQLPGFLGIFVTTVSMTPNGVWTNASRVRNKLEIHEHRLWFLCWENVRKGWNWNNSVALKKILTRLTKYFLNICFIRFVYMGSAGLPSLLFSLGGNSS